MLSCKQHRCPELRGGWHEKPLILPRAIRKGIVLFALPILFSELLQNLYNNVDALVVGNFVGSDSLAAVSVSAPITKLIVGFLRA